MTAHSLHCSVPLCISHEPGATASTSRAPDRARHARARLTLLGSSTAHLCASHLRCDVLRLSSHVAGMEVASAWSSYVSGSAVAGAARTRRLHCEATHGGSAARWRHRVARPRSVCARAVDSRVACSRSEHRSHGLYRGAGLALDEQPVAMHHVCVRMPVGHTRDDAVGGVGAGALAPARARGECSLQSASR